MMLRRFVDMRAKTNKQATQTPVWRVACGGVACGDDMWRMHGHLHFQRPLYIIPYK
jgi:hypothetical protein